MAKKTTFIGRLTAPFAVPTSAGVVYTTSASPSQDILKRIVFHNSGGSDATVQIWLVPTGGSRTTATKIDQQLVKSNKRYVWEDEYLCNSADEVHMVCDQSTVSCHILGTTFTDA